MESKDLNNLTNKKCDQKSKCSCNNDNNGHQSTKTNFNAENPLTTVASMHNEYVQPDTQSNMKKNEEIEHLEDRINQINNDNSTSFVIRRNQYNRSTNSINNNIINDNEINTDSHRPNDMEGKMSSNCDNVTSTESDRIQMELQNIGVNNYKRSNLLMNRGCDNRNITNATILASFIERNNQCIGGNGSEMRKTLNNSSIHSIANNVTAITPSTSKGSDYVPMAPIKSGDKIQTEQNCELTNSLKQMSLPSDDGEYK